MNYKFNKEKFLQSELGRILRAIVIGLYTFPSEIQSLKSSNSYDFEELKSLEKTYKNLIDQLNVIFVALKQFYGLDCKYEISTIENSIGTDFIVYCNDEILYSSSQFMSDIN